MNDETFTKIDIIIIIILSLLVAFIIGFNIIQIIDNKLSSVVINVPPQNCKLPPIYLKFDKDNNMIKLETETENNISNDVETKEAFGNLPFKYDIRNNINEYSQKLVKSKETDMDTYYQDDNYNTFNDLPFLVEPDDASSGYYPNRLKLITNPDSKMLGIERDNLNKINNILSKCNKNSNNNINDTFNGYNKYPSLKNDSYANITSIGKSLMTPYISYPTSVSD